MNTTQIAPTDPLVFACADYDGLELRTMAQACINLVGFSKLAEMLNAGIDPHLVMAGNMLGLGYEETKRRYKAEKTARAEAFASAKARGLGDQEATIAATRDVPPTIADRRTGAKGMNFGFPGGMGTENFPAYAWKGYKFLIDERETARCKAIWLETFPEFRAYFKLIKRLETPTGYRFEHLYSRRLRGAERFPMVCNSLFQGLGADATGAAVFCVSEACYVPTPCPGCEGAGCAPCLGRGVSPLYGTRLVNYVHDELIVETPEERGHEVVHELVRVMCAAAAPYLPDVPPTAEPKLMRFWSKEAEQVWVDTSTGKRLVPWPTN